MSEGTLSFSEDKSPILDLFDNNSSGIELSAQKTTRTGKSGNYQ